MNSQSETIVIAAMQQRSMPEWNKPRRKLSIAKKQWGYLAAGVLCLAVGVFTLAADGQSKDTALSVMSSGFEYDETLGRLQYVSSILPENAMVFLSSSVTEDIFYTPSESKTVHSWSEEEPWLEYQGESRICACETGEVMTIVENRDNKYTVRIRHSDGYESVYSGLTSLNIHENSSVAAGEQIGYASESAAFELRRDGLSVLPVFSFMEDEP